ncbi:TIGR04086 family membrane protein [Sinanaerobacter sp. ZZT-01]|uniref:TIGR04086 family membrane protein n=1 Tax=Sinanaerobacter sp. ZZT-01 TaxID=3111540 RepID=UPI002D775F8D|nr:TIGR04086 family membrane protein [Sinanaerobacter sp. ZZT-01]WRR93161.1 TIGR04086 family membrane protein [Sinanaerobacter sp. ZZT-01]
MKGFGLHNYITKGIKAFVFSFLLFFVLFTMLSLLLMFTALPEKGILYYILIICGIASFFIGIQAGVVFKKRGLIFGALFAGILLLSILLLSFVLSGMENSISFLRLRYLPCIVLGSLGGMFGVNLKI